MSIEERVIIQDDVVESPTNFHRRHRCCFHFPCFGSPPSTTTRHVTLGGPTTSTSTPSFWDRFRTPDSDSRWWARPFMKIREWSEILAGPQWKTFIRRFNRRRHNHRHHHHHHSQSAQFQYDPLSYALNFDEGPGQNGHFDEDYNNGHFPDFSSRFAAVPLTSPRKSHTTDLGNGAPPLQSC